MVDSCSITGYAHVVASPRAPRRQRLPVDERRARLLELGRDFFSRRSYDAVSIEDLAEAAGISKGLLYHYFPSKRSLYVETVRHAVDEMRTSAAPDPALPPIERLQASLERYLDFVERNGALYAAVMRSGIGLDPEVNRIVEDFRTTVMGWVLGAFGLTAPRPALRTALRAWMGFVEGASQDWVVHRDVGREAMRRLFAESLRVALFTAAEVDPDAGLVLPPPRQ
jgi:AcrR family transcriptional regulator